MVQCVSLLSEFEHVKQTQWAADNKMIINISKTKELVFQRPSLKHFLAPSAVCGIEQVPSAKLLGVIFKNNLSRGCIASRGKNARVSSTFLMAVRLQTHQQLESIPRAGASEVITLWCYRNSTILLPVIIMSRW